MPQISYDVLTGEIRTIDPRFSAMCLINGGFLWSLGRHPTDAENAALQVRIQDAYRRGLTDDWDIASAAVEAEGWKATLARHGEISVMEIEAL